MPAAPRGRQGGRLRRCELNSSWVPGQHRRTATADLPYPRHVCLHRRAPLQFVYGCTHPPAVVGLRWGWFRFGFSLTTAAGARKVLGGGLGWGDEQSEWGVARATRRSSSTDSLRRRDRPWDAVVAGADRHPGLERQKRSRTRAGHLAARPGAAAARPGAAAGAARPGAGAARIGAGGSPRSSARRAQTASSRSRSPTAPGHCSASTSTRGQERGRGTRETSSRNARPRPNALAIPRSPTPSGSSRHAWPATRSAHLSKHTRAAPGRAVHLVATPIVKAGRGAKTNGVNSAAPPQAE